MDSKLYIHRAENEIKLAQIIFVISKQPNIQRETFKVNEPETYFSAVIAHSYYSIFYGAKAYLIKKGLEISAPEEHKKAIDENLPELTDDFVKTLGDFADVQDFKNKISVILIKIMYLVRNTMYFF